MSFWNDSTVQGRFTADGAVKTISIRSDFDWIEVENQTAKYQSSTDLAFRFVWQRGQTDGRGDVWTKLGNVANDPITVAQIAVNGGFLEVDTSSETDQLSSAVAITGGTNITEPVFSTASTANLVSGTIVRLTTMTGQINLAGYDFTIDTIVSNTSFKMAAPLATAPGAAATAGTYRIVRYYPGFLPRWRYISKITQADEAVITTTVPSGYEVGQRLKVVVPVSTQSGVNDFGMIEMNGLYGTVKAIDDTVGTQTVTLDIDSTGFTAFTFPTAAQAAKALSKAMLVPAGADDNTIDSDDVTNVDVIGVRLLNPQASGTAGPAGATGDVMYWKAGKSTKVTNE